jgi:signal transduction histidine kinase
MGVSVDKDKKIWQIAVTDTGIGISPTEQQFIFESFRQIDGSTTREYGGTGLGLSITQKMVHMMEGTITVSSQLGKGSTFTVTFPLVQPPNPHEALIQMSQRKTAVN